MKRKTFCVVIIINMLIAFCAGCVTDGETNRGEPTDELHGAVNTEDYLFEAESEESIGEPEEEISLLSIADQSNREIKKMFSGMSDIMSVEVSLRDESIVYMFSYVEDIEDIEYLRAAYEESHNPAWRVFRDYSENLYYMGFYNSSLILEYYTNDGRLIYSLEYKKHIINW